MVIATFPNVGTGNTALSLMTISPTGMVTLLAPLNVTTTSELLTIVGTSSSALSALCMSLITNGAVLH
jgi:hypothetical protein